MNDMEDDCSFTKRLLKLLAAETIVWTGFLVLALVFNLVKSPLGFVTLGSLLVVTVYATVSRYRNRRPKG